VNHLGAWIIRGLHIDEAPSQLTRSYLLKELDRLEAAPREGTEANSGP
jgi:hypothetical protein